jgi:hypothetical protein
VEIARQFAEFSDHLAVAEVADCRVAGTAEGHRADMPQLA